MGLVNPKRGDEVSKLLYNAVVASYDNRPGAVVELHSAFRGVRVLRPDFKPRECYESMDSDGTGTKVEIAERLADHSTIAFDLFAMIADDAVIKGGETVAISTILDVNQLLENNVLKDKAIKEIADGYIKAAQQARVVLLGGETAEIGSRVTGYGAINYNWCGTGLWYAHPERLLTGKKIKLGDKLIGFKDNGFRSNGLSDVRQILYKTYGKDWHKTKFKNSTVGKLVQTPSTIYSGLMIDLTGGFDINKKPLANITGAAHITGGGQPSKIKDMLEASGLGLVIDDPIEPPEIMKFVQEKSGFSDEKAYGKWHMGPGMVVTTTDPDVVITEAKRQGIEAKVIGEVIKDKSIKVKNQGIRQDKKWIEFPLAS